ncbi:hypothetical protein [Streptomyces sp. YIM S03343]
MTTRISPLYATHASPESIEIAIREAEAKASALRRLLDVRRAQIAAGTWPPKDDSSPVTA